MYMDHFSKGRQLEPSTNIMMMSFKVGIWEASFHATMLARLASLLLTTLEVSVYSFRQPASQAGRQATIVAFKYRSSC